MNRKIIFLSLGFFILCILLVVYIFYSKNNESAKIHSLLANDNNNTVIYKNKQHLEVKNIKKDKFEKQKFVGRKTIDDNLTIKDVNINNFNKFFNYKNIDILLNSYINTTNHEMQNYIILRFHNEIKNPEVVNKLINMYNATSNKKEKMRLSVLLSEINTDEKLNIFYENIDLNNNDMIADFVASTKKINSENSTKKLFSLIDDIYNKNFHIKGIELIYSDSDYAKTLKNIDNIIANNNFTFSNEQEKFIIFILKKAPSKNSLSFINKYKYNFSTLEDITNIEKIKKINVRK